MGQRLKTSLVILGCVGIGLFIAMATMTTPVSEIPSNLTEKEREIYQTRLDSETLLSKYFPDSAYVVRVDITHTQSSVITEHRLTPDKVDLENNETTNGPLVDMFGQTTNPSRENIQSIYENRLDTPKLTIEKKISKSLPGLPVRNESPSPAQNNQQSPQKSFQEQDVKTTKTSQQVFFNQEEEQRVVEAKVDRMVVRIMLDQSSLSLSSIDERQLRSFLMETVGFDQDRGDSLIISLSDFEGFRFAWQRFVLRNHGFWKPLQDFYFRYELLMLGIFLLSCFVGMGIYFWIKRRLAHKCQAAEALPSETAESANSDTDVVKVGHVGTEEQKEEILKLASTNPESVAHNIIGWIKNHG